MKAVALRTDNRINPIGIDHLQPVFRWKCEGGKFQKAYQVVVVDEDKEGEVVFDSNRVETHETYCVCNANLESMHRYRWMVTLTDDRDETEVSEEATFEMGLLRPGDWKAHWISGKGTDVEERLPADYYKAHFSVTKKVVRARLYATALGVYFVRINGKRLPGTLAPGFTNYHERVYYQTYDITSILLNENDWEIVVGDGWYKGKIGRHNSQCFYGNQTMTLGQIVMTYDDGSMEILGTGEHFLWCNDGPIRYNDMKDGEVYDARMIPTYSMNAVEQNPEVQVCAQVGPPVTEHEAFAPKVLQNAMGKVLLDFGQNFAGYIRFRVRGEFGDNITFYMCEALDNGEYSDATFAFEQENAQKIEFVCSGIEEDYQPEFFYCGFRYALVDGWKNFQPEAVRGIAVYSDMDYSGLFLRTSDKRLDQWLYNARWTMKSNFVSVPTDNAAGSRSARTGDAYVFLQAASYLADTAAFYDKWVQDIADEQREDGRINNFCPNDTDQEGKDAVNGTVGWMDAAAAICYRMWQLYGHAMLTKEHREMLCKWRDYVASCGHDKFIYQLPKNHPLQKKVLTCLLRPSPYNQYIVESGMQWGEWSDPEGEDALGTDPVVMRPRQELNAAITADTMAHLGILLEELEAYDDADECFEMSYGAHRGYRFHFLSENHHHMERKRQAPLVRALYLNLADEAAEKAIISRDLDRMVTDNDYRVGTGFYGTAYLLNTLAEFGFEETAYKVLMNVQAPGWLSQLAQGATTAWESFVGYDEEGHPLNKSMNHCGAAAAILFAIEDIAGVHVTEPYTFKLAPIPGGDLDFCDFEYESPYGMVKIHWEKTSKGYDYDFTVPSNTRAHIQLVDGQEYTVYAGEHHYSYDSTKQMY